MSKLRKAKTGAAKPAVTNEEELTNVNEENETAEEQDLDETEELEQDEVETEEEEVEPTEEEEKPAVEAAPAKEKDSGLTVSNPSANSGEKKVRIKPNRDFRAYIGDQFYNLKKDVEDTVPFSVKQKLQKAGMLSTL